MRHCDIRVLSQRLGPRRSLPSVPAPWTPASGPGTFRPFHGGVTLFRKGSKKSKKKAALLREEKELSLFPRHFNPSPPPSPSPAPTASNEASIVRDGAEKPDIPGSRTRRELTDVYKSNPFVVLDFQDPDTPDAGMRFASRENLLLDAEVEDNAPAEEFEIDNPGRHAFLKRGDLVQLMTTTTGTQSVAAVYIRTFENGKSQFLTMHGQVKYESDTRVIFTVPDYFTHSQLDPILPYVPKNVAEYRKMVGSRHLVEWDVPRSVTASVIGQLQEFWMECEELQRREAKKLPLAHSILAHRTESRFLTVQQIAAEILSSDPTPASLFMIERALSWYTLEFSINNLHHRTSRIIHVRSQSFVKKAKRVRDVIRTYQFIPAASRHADVAKNESIPEDMKPYITELQKFISQCRSSIEASRKLRQNLPTANSLGPWDKSQTVLPPTAVTKPRFSPIQKDFNWFLKQLTLTSAFSVDASMTAVGAFLIREIGLYDDQSESMQYRQETGYRLLQEIGVIRPFENKALYDSELILPYYGSSHRANELKQKAEETDPSDLTDRMKDYRKNWGSMDVYCIDSREAEEIDDGVSVSRIPGKDDEFWVHVHVANPTAFFSPNDVLGQSAELRAESVYLPEGTFNLMPKHLTDELWSLGPGKPALTFSVRLRSDGEVLEKEVTSGIVNNVHRLTPAEVGKIISPDAEVPRKDQFVLSVGDEPLFPKPREHPMDQYTPRQRDDLSLLHSLSKALLNRRLLAGAVDMEIPQPQISLSFREDFDSLLDRKPAAAPADGRPPTQPPKVLTPDPTVQITGPEYDPLPAGTPIPGSLLVREMMVLAGRVAGEWMEERKIPTVYRASARNEDLQDPATYYRDVYLPACTMSPDGKTVVKPPPRPIVSEYMNLLGKVLTSTVPSPHLALGIDRYVKVTSPLRRYGDMIAHWQIEAHIRSQNKPQRRSDDSSLTGLVRALHFSERVSDRGVDSAAPVYPFTEHTLSTYALPLLSWRERRIRIVAQQSVQHWIAVLFFRALHFDEPTTGAVLPGKWSVYVNPREWVTGQAETDIDDGDADDADGDSEPGDGAGGSPNPGSGPNPFEMYQDPSISDHVTSPALAQMSVVPIPSNASAKAGLIKGTVMENSMRCHIRIPDHLRPDMDDDRPSVWDARLTEVDVYNRQVIFEAVGLLEGLDGEGGGDA